MLDAGVPLPNVLPNPEAAGVELPKVDVMPELPPNAGAALAPKVEGVLDAGVPLPNVLPNPEAAGVELPKVDGVPPNAGAALAPKVLDAGEAVAGAPAPNELPNPEVAEMAGAGVALAPAAPKVGAPLPKDGNDGFAAPWPNDGNDEPPRSALLPKTDPLAGARVATGAAVAAAEGAAGVADAAIGVAPKLRAAPNAGVLAAAACGCSATALLAGCGAAAVAAGLKPNVAPLPNDRPPGAAVAGAAAGALGAGVGVDALAPAPNDKPLAAGAGVLLAAGVVDGEAEAAGWPNETPNVPSDRPAGLAAAGDALEGAALAAVNERPGAGDELGAGVEAVAESADAAGVGVGMPNEIDGNVTPADDGAGAPAASEAAGVVVVVEGLALPPGMPRAFEVLSTEDLEDASDDVMSPIRSAARKRSLACESSSVRSMRRSSFSRRAAEDWLAFVMVTRERERRSFWLSPALTSKCGVDSSAPPLVAGVVAPAAVLPPAVGTLSGVESAASTVLMWIDGAVSEMPVAPEACFLLPPAATHVAGLCLVGDDERVVACTTTDGLGPSEIDLGAAIVGGVVSILMMRTTDGFSLAGREGESDGGCCCDLLGAVKRDEEPGGDGKVADRFLLLLPLLLLLGAFEALVGTLVGDLLELVASTAIWRTEASPRICAIFCCRAALLPFAREAPDDDEEDAATDDEDCVEEELLRAGVATAATVLERPDACGGTRRSGEYSRSRVF